MQEQDKRSISTVLGHFAQRVSKLDSFNTTALNDTKDIRTSVRDNATYITSACDFEVATRTKNSANQVLKPEYDQFVKSTNKKLKSLELKSKGDVRNAEQSNAPRATPQFLDSDAEKAITKLSSDMNNQFLLLSERMTNILSSFLMRTQTCSYSHPPTASPVV